jgi:hypothetical protein
MAKGRIYVSSIDNLNCFGGYLPGTAKNNFCWVERDIKEITEDEYGTRCGKVKIMNVVLQVRHYSGVNDWKIDKVLSRAW